MLLTKSKIFYTLQTSSFFTDFSFSFYFGCDAPRFFAKKRFFFSVFQGFQSASELTNFDFILPGCAFTEKSIVHMDMFGKLHFQPKIFTPLSLAKHDSFIINQFSSLYFSVFQTFSYKLPTPTTFQNTLNENNLFKGFSTFFNPLAVNLFGTHLIFFKSPFLSLFTNFFSSEPITILSKQLAICSQLYLASHEL